MKKQLLLGSALFAAISAFSQQSYVKNAVPKLAYKAGTIASKYAVVNEPTSVSTELTAVKPTQAVKTKNKSRSAANSFGWEPISQSMNVFGVLLAESKPLQYDENLDAVSFIQRKSPHYVPDPIITNPDPAAHSGGIVAMVTTNWGSTWDSTLIWNNDTYWARYPQGGLYNPSGNSNITNAYAVATGPITQATGGWTGNFFASKKLDVFDNKASTATKAQQFISSKGPTFDTIQKVDYARLSFQATDDGIMHSMGVIVNDPNPGGTYGFRGARLLKGTFNAGGYFDWTSDSLSLLPAVKYDNTSNTYDAIGGLASMAWSESGQYGYAWFVGVRIGATSQNSGYQPIVWKTSNYGASWLLMPGINFADTASTTFDPVMTRLLPVRFPVADSLLKIPFFNFREDISGVVDKNNNLHLVATLWSTSKGHPDSTGYTYNFNHTDGETYSYAHDSLIRPYIYDFTSNANGSWGVTLIDSMDTEAPGTATTDEGYAANPWAVYDGSKQSSNARIQASRTPGGEFIVYTWAESDILVTSSGLRWNNIPDIHARVRHADSINVHAMEYNLSNDPNDPNGPSIVANRGWMHNVSPKCALTATAANGFTITLPVKVSNNNTTPMKPDVPVTHYYSSAAMSFTVVDVTGIADNSINSVNGSVIYPNPAKDNATLRIALTDNADVNVSIMNTVGQLVKTSSVKGEVGKNDIAVDVDGLAPGIYLVNVKLGNATSTKKLIVE
jgi:hypothetical protein